MDLQKISVQKLVEEKNKKKILFTPGPASLLQENIEGISPCFGRGDIDYLKVENQVLNYLKELSGHKNIVRLQGSSSLALEIIIANFIYGKVLIIDSGYYSSRLKDISNSYRKENKNITNLNSISWEKIEDIKENYDWIIACYTETSCGLKLPIERIHSIAKRVNARLMLDATASIGLEENHHLADVIGYSSCKGLCGLTGAGFIAFNEPGINSTNSFYLNINTHIEKKITGPYHSISSIYNVIPKYKEIKHSIIINKKRFQKIYKDNLTLEEEYQPMLCTYVNCKLKSNSKKVVLYEPRINKKGSIICHLGEVHLGKQSTGKIIDKLLKDR